MKPPSNHNYTVSGADGRNEGPFTLDEVKARISTGKITGATFIQRDDAEHWSTAADFPELGVKDVVVNRYDKESGPDALTKQAEESHYTRAIRSGASWFFWIAALSFINSLCAFFGSEWGFALGLSVTYVLGEIGSLFGPRGDLIALVINLLASTLYLFFGVAGWQKYFTPYLLGMFLYAGDAILSFVAGDWISAGIHVLALVFLFRGLQTHLEIRGRGWSPAVFLRGALCVLLVGGVGWGLWGAFGRSVEKLPPEAWVSQPHDEWPGLVLSHYSEFRGHSGLKGASAFLLELPDQRIIAATAKHLLGVDGGVTPDLRLEELDRAILAWKLSPRSKATNAVVVAGLFGQPELYGEQDDWLLLKVAEKKPRYPASPLRVRQKPLRKGEPVYIVGVRYENRDDAQEVFSGKITSASQGLVEGELDTPVNLDGFSGAPVLDAGGHVVAVVSGARSEPDKDGRYSTFAGHGVGEITRILQSVKPE